MTLSDDGVTSALDAVNAAGGDVTQPTTVVDSDTGRPVAVLQQLPDGSVQVTAATQSNVQSSVNVVTGFIDNIAGGLQVLGTEIERIGNAFRGAVAGAEAGYNAPTDWKPVILGALAIGAGVYILSKIAGRR